jgi:hypothetical protein
MAGGSGEGPRTSGRGGESRSGSCPDEQATPARGRKRRFGDEIEGRSLRLARGLARRSQRQFAELLRCGSKKLGKQELGILQAPRTLIEDAGERAGLPRQALTILAEAARGDVDLTNEQRAWLGEALLIAALTSVRGPEPTP